MHFPLNLMEQQETTNYLVELFSQLFYFHNYSLYLY